MATYAIVPVKRIGVSKRRLSEFLSQHERKLLAAAMLEDVLHALKLSVVDETVVVSSDPDVMQIASRLDASTFSASRQGLNSDLQEAMDWCLQRGADSVLILPADLPLVSPKDINMLVKLGRECHGAVLAPSNDGGTNALYQSLPNLISPCFGKNSFVKHVKEAICKRVLVRFYYSLGVGLDIDSVEDLQALRKASSGTLSGQVLSKILGLKVIK
jgi:2-phospho-L-lactate guanylyltransferase